MVRPAPLFRLVTRNRHAHRHCHVQWRGELCRELGSPLTQVVGPITELPLPSSATDLISGPDGNLWFLENNGSNVVGTIDPATGAVSEFSLATTYGLTQLTVGPDGNLWFLELEPGLIGYFNPTTRAVTEFPTPAPSNSTLAGQGLTAGPDGNLWYVEAKIENDTFASVNRGTHAFSAIPVPGFEYSVGSMTAGPTATSGSRRARTS